jgi:hypothetical protein
MGEHAGGQGAGAKLRPASTRRRRSRLLGGRNFGGAQADVTWIRRRRSRSARRRPGVPLAGQRGHATVARQPAARARRDVEARRCRGTAATARSPQAHAGQPCRGRTGNRGGRKTAGQCVDPRLDVTRRCRWRRCGGQGQVAPPASRAGGAAGASRALGRHTGQRRLLPARPAAARGVGRARSHSRGNLPPTSRAEGAGRAVVLAGRPWLPPCGDGAGTRRPAGRRLASAPGPAPANPAAGRRAAARGPDRREERSGLGGAGKGATLGRLGRRRADRAARQGHPVQGGPAPASTRVRPARPRRDPR